jgi:SAM-dependent methyltransferase
MVQTSNGTSQKPRSVQEFYDLLAPNYDEMTGFENRFVQERPFFRLLVERYGIKKAIDAGCGSGFHSLLLSELGVQVTAIDVSPEMARLTREHARIAGLELTVVEGAFKRLESLVPDQFDGVFVMGNSLAHLLDKTELAASLRNFSARLRRGGILFVQMLNYERILESRDRIQSSKQAGNKTFVRFYDYGDHEVLFNILTLERGDGEIEERLETIRLKPIVREELEKLLKEAGFDDIKFYGGISMEPFEPLKSKDLVVLARVPS